MKYSPFYPALIGGVIALLVAGIVWFLPDLRNDDFTIAPVLMPSLDLGESKKMTYTSQKQGISFEYDSISLNGQGAAQAVKITENDHEVQVSGLPTWFIVKKFPHTSIQDRIAHHQKKVNDQPPMANELLDQGLVKVNGITARELVLRFDSLDSHIYLFQRGSDVTEIYTSDLRYTQEILNSFRLLPL